jgi:hypothetical protein
VADDDNIHLWPKTLEDIKEQRERDEFRKDFEEFEEGRRLKLRCFAMIVKSLIRRLNGDRDWVNDLCYVVNIDPDDLEDVFRELDNIKSK